MKLTTYQYDLERRDLNATVCYVLYPVCTFFEITNHIP